jgi:hypothetical protein
MFLRNVGGFSTDFTAFYIPEDRNFLTIFLFHVISKMFHLVGSHPSTVFFSPFFFVHAVWS